MKNVISWYITNRRRSQISQELWHIYSKHMTNEILFFPAVKNRILLSREFYKSFNVLNFNASRTFWLILAIGNSSHTNARGLSWSRKHMTIRNWRPRSSCFQLSSMKHCYPLYIDQVRWLESMLYKVIVTAIFLILLLLMNYKRD